jgi:hypothetical protein
MNNYLLRLTMLRTIMATVISLVLSSVAMGQVGATAVPPMPPILRVPEGNVLYFKGFAVGTQNYVCVPGANGPSWNFLGPQATVFLTFPWFQGEGRQQITTHFLSGNPGEDGTARPAWQHSFDSSTVWGKAIVTVTDPEFVTSGAIPWLLLEVVGTQRGPMDGSALAQTTYIQRLNTLGGVAPVSGCDASTYGAVARVPYTTDYYFYKADNRN